MQTIPTNKLRPGQEVITGLSCTDCSGVLMVRQEGDRGFLVFRCRVGHSFSLSELLAGKERSIEEHMWSAVATLEELGRLLEELAAHGIFERPESFLDRSSRARSTIGFLRSIIASNDPVQFERSERLPGHGA